MSQAADKMTTTADRLIASLHLQRLSFEQQIQDAEQFINETADQLCKFIENERRRLLQETYTIHHNTMAELSKACLFIANLINLL